MLEEDTWHGVGKELEKHSEVQGGSVSGQSGPSGEGSGLDQEGESGDGGDRTGVSKQGP